MFDQFGRVICADCYGVMLVSSVQPGTITFKCTDGTCGHSVSYDKYNWKPPAQRKYAKLATA